ESGECIVALPQNDPELVEKLISMLGWDPQSPVPINDHGDTVPIVEALTSHFEFTKLTLPLLKNADIYFDNEELSERIQDESWAREYVINRDFID
ncbi:sulfite reductase [NADPH] flavoprotein alpha-component, partial [Escherichia coli]|nr:sulfite reductase [NADPH] flavoprotein alpha-component [Escherichia coli]